MISIFLWVLFAALVGMVASSKGRSGILFFFVSLILSPLIGLIIALVVSPNTAKVEQSQVLTGEMRKCPECAELVKSEARLCKHCQSPLEPVSVKDTAGIPRDKYYILLNGNEVVAVEAGTFATEPEIDKHLKKGFVDNQILIEAPSQEEAVNLYKMGQNEEQSEAV